MALWGNCFNFQVLIRFENGLEANVFTGNTSGITIGDNGTPQVVIVSGKDVEGSSADITLAHELIHALRGEKEIKSINLIGGINKDEEAHTIELENKIRHELGYDYRKDGDKSDGGDASYGEFKDQLTGNDWYDNIDKISKSHTLSGNPYANSIIGAIVHAVKTAARIISSSSKKKKKHSRSSSSSSSNNEWGSNYDDSVWTSTITPVIDKIVSSVDNWRSTTKPKQDWNAFWNTTSSKISDSTKKIYQ